MILVSGMVLVVGEDSEDAELGLSMTSFLGKFSSLRMVNKKGPVLVMDYQLLEKSTGNFHEGNVLGKGAFGCVYKGKLDDDIHIAVKKLDSSSNDASKVFEVEQCPFHGRCCCALLFSSSLLMECNGCDVCVGIAE